MRLTTILTLAALTAQLSGAAVIQVPHVDGDATHVLQSAIDKAAMYNGKDVTIRLATGNYDISRDSASCHIYHISNTSSVEENPDQTKHIGLWLRNLRNVTIDGNGAKIITHGEMTSIVIDGCENITLKNFTLTAADPSVAEMKIVAVDRGGFTMEVTEPTQFDIVDGDFRWCGEGWQFGQWLQTPTLPEYAQVFYPQSNETFRVESPMKGRKSAYRLSDRLVRVEFDRVPDVHVGEIYQIRHGIRREACSFINRSRNVEYSDIDFNFLGNFGLVGQYSENITYDNISCRPALDSERTDAGFADFVQMSGCKGKVRVVNSWFEGAHDDPINIHGTHLQVDNIIAPDKVVVKFMHGQTYGFEAFFKGDEVELVNRHTLTPALAAKVKSAHMVDDYRMELTLDKPLPGLGEGETASDYALENVTWTPEVEIRNNYFARTPTRGILITTRRKSVIENNVFFRMPMASILVSDDARGWYESGPVHDLTIRGNKFIECASPVVMIWPEIDKFDQPVHRNILIEGNRFVMRGDVAVKVNASDNVCLKDNLFEMPDGRARSIESLIETTDNCKVTSEGNVIEGLSIK